VTNEEYLNLNVAWLVDVWPYSKNKLELETNLSDILPVNCKFVRSSTLFHFDKTQTWVLDV